MKNLIRLYLWPLIKRFKALFITMAVLTAIGVTSIIAFNGISKGITENYNKYIDKSHAPNAFISTDLKDYSAIEDEIKNQEGVKKVEKCIFLPCSSYLIEKQETKSTQMFTFDEHHDTYKPTFYEGPKTFSDDLANVYVESAFAKLNDIHAGQTMRIGYFEQYIDIYVAGVVSYPDTVVYGASNAVSTENSNFGRIYIEKGEVKSLLVTVVEKLKNYVATELGLSEKTKESINSLIDKLEQYKGYFSDEIQKYANRLSIYFEDDANQRETLNRVKVLLEEKGINILESYLFNESLSASLIDSASSAMKTAGAAVSIFVFGTTITVLTMFLLQIIREMMRDIGVMSALGIKKEHIMGLLALFSLIISIIGTAFGVFFGHLIEFILDKLVGNTFGVATKAPPLRFLNTVLAFVMVIFASQIATFFASLRITKLMPVDALNDQASSKKVLPPSIDKKFQHSPPAVRLTVNSIVTKPKRFITSFFAILATGLIIFTSIAALTSFKSALNNTFDKYIQYDAQVVFASDPKDFKSELDSLNAASYEETRYATPVLSFNGKEEIITLQGLSIDTTKVVIPVSKKETAKVPEEGITVNMITAKSMGIKEGDKVLIDGHEVNVAYISKLEAYNVCFCNIEKIGGENGYANNDVISYLISGVDKEALVRQVTNYHYDAMVTLTADQKNYFSSRFKTLEMVCIVFIVFSIGLGALIVSLMMQTSLIEQKRDLCIMRSVGFSMSQISWIWSFVSALQFVLAMAVSIPLSFFATKLFLSITSTKMAMVLSYANAWHVLMTSALVIFFMLFAHFFCMSIVKRWNIADNTKSRE